MKLLFETGGERWIINCETSRAPVTLAALSSTLPMPLQLHTPKVAGNHIYWHAPFIVDVEGGMNVLSAPPGAFIYWPVRQFLEITYAPLQAETATVSVLGQLDGPVEGIARLAESLRRQQGRRIFTGLLSRADDKQINGDQQGGKLIAVPAALHAARLSLWTSCPDDVAALTASRGLMHPAGPTFVADGEARALHETLWWIREQRNVVDVERRRFAAGLMLGRVATRLRDFCHFTTSADILFSFEAAIGNSPETFEDLLDEAMLCSGRLSAWIDLTIPWNDVNEGFRMACDTANADSSAKAAE